MVCEFLTNIDPHAWPPTGLKLALGTGYYKNTVSVSPSNHFVVAMGGKLH